MAQGLKALMNTAITLLNETKSGTLLLLNSWHRRESAAKRRRAASTDGSARCVRDKHWVGSRSTKQSHEVGILKNVREQFLIEPHHEQRRQRGEALVDVDEHSIQKYIQQRNETQNQYCDFSHVSKHISCFKLSFSADVRSVGQVFEDYQSKTREMTT